MKKLLLILLIYSSFLNAEDKTTLCITCHGPKGISANPQWPHLAGQNNTYLKKQLKDLKAGTQRSSPLMTSVLATLDNKDIDDLAAIYAKMPAPKGATAQPLIVKRGEQIYKAGDASKHITACIICHGPKGTGNNQAGFPLIAGQNTFYTITQLNAFKQKTRTNDLNHIMQDICSKMNEKDIEAVSHYIESLY